MVAYEATPWFGAIANRPGETESAHEVHSMLVRTGLIEDMSFYFLYEAADTLLRMENCKLETKGLLLQMLPRQLELEGSFALTADENGVHLTPVSMQVGEKSFSLSGLPSDTFSAIDSGLNALLENAGVRFSSAEFTDEGILLK